MSWKRPVLAMFGLLALTLAGCIPQQDQLITTDPAWSPDGTRVAFVSNRDGNLEIYIVDMQSGAVNRLTNNESNEIAPTWSPDGTQIIFSSDRTDNWELYVMDADGFNVKRLTGGP
ncbi:MAG: TolB family protein [Candidatus Bipolaricaulia bacterium]